MNVSSQLPSAPAPLPAIPVREQLAAAFDEAVTRPMRGHWQPWRLRLSDSHLDFLADYERISPGTDPDGRELVIACGAALHRLEAFLERRGCLGSLRFFPDIGEPALLARIRPCPSRPIDTVADTRASASDPPELEAEHPATNPIHRFCECARKQRAWLEVIECESLREQLRELVLASDLRQMANPAFRRDFSAHLRFYRSSLKPDDPTSALGFGRDPDLGTAWLGLAVAAFNVGRILADIDHNRVRHCEILAVLKTRGDDPRCWLAAGHALGGIAAEARRLGLKMSLVNQVVQCPQTRSELRATIGRRGYPQLVLRLDRH